MLIKTFRMCVIAAAVTAAAGIGLAPSALAEETICRGSIGATTVDDLTVPQDGFCTLNGTRVHGTVKVHKDATLHASGVHLTGNLQSDGAREIRVSRSSVGGSIQHVQGAAADLAGNTVNGDVQVFTNRGTLSVRANQINGNLQCKENQPAPTGGGNVVGGNKEDQCAML